VIATVRDIPKAEAALTPLPKASGSRVLTVQMEMGSFDTITSGVETLKKTHNISSIDVVIANAGFVGPTLSLAHAPVSELQPFIDINAYGPFELFKAVLPLLRASSSSAENKGKFVYVSSGAGSLNGMLNIRK
jgi:norsolorinic acid ketoreductase